MDLRHKVIYFSDAIFLGGAEEYLKLLIPRIDQDRYEPRVALTYRPEILPLADYFARENIAVDFVETHSKSPLENFLAPWRYFREQKPAIVHFNLNNSFACFFPALAAWVSGVPWKLATEHLTFELASGKRAGIHTKEVVKRILTFCLDYTIAVSQANKQILVEDYRINPHLVKLIRNGIDVDRFTFSEVGRWKVRREFGIPDETFLVGTVARFSFQKGHEYIIQAIPKILEVFPKTRFLWVGDGPEHDHLLEMVRQAKLEPYIFFAGVRDDIACVLSAMDVFLLTSIFEGLPLSVLEAMAVGLPVIATAVNGTPEAVTPETGKLVPPADPDAVSKAVIELLSNAEERNWLREQGFKRVHKYFDSSFMVKQVEDLYDHLTAESPKTALQGHSARSSSQKASIIVLSWNKKELLEEALNAVQTAVEYEGGGHEIILVDNGSSDGTQDYIRTQYPRVRLIELDKNYRFCRANNIAVQCAKNEIVVLLNNDVIVERDFLGPLLKGFEYPDTFAVSSQIFNYDQSKSREETGKTFGSLVFGCVHVGHSQPNEADEKRGYVPVFYAGGGSSAYSREKFLALGGFNEVYNPGYVEDADLSYRAWKSGYRVLFCPKSRVIHKHRSTNVTLFGNRKIDYLISRNLFVLFWQNVTSLKLVLKHVLMLPLRILLDVSRGHLAILKAFVGAMLRVPTILWKRVTSKPLSMVSDEEILETIDYWFFYRHRFLVNSGKKKGSCKILIVSKRLPRLGLDGSWILVNLIKDLSRNHEISLLAFTESEDDAPYIAYLSQFCTKVKTIPLYPYSEELKSSFLISKLFAVLHAFLLMRKEVLNELKTGDYDIVQCEYLHTLNFTPDLSRYPSVLTHHEALSLAYERNFQRVSGPLRKLWAFLKYKVVQGYEKRICRKVKTIVTLSPIDQAYLKSRLKIADSRVVPSGVDLDYFRPFPDDQEIPASLLFVGYFKHPPNVEGMHYFFQEIWPSIIEHRPEARITVIGRHVPPEILAYSRKDAVIFADSVSDLRPYFQQHSVFVAPIVSGAGLRGKILEAMAMGKAVVVTRRGVEGYPFRHGEALMIADSSEEFVAYTLDLLKDPGLRRRLGEQARTCVEAQFGAEGFSRSYEEVYQDLFQ
jgi:glycosyltransferase involved in cell wall biosynthesis/GT2 family glycosyltransferase